MPALVHVPAVVPHPAQLAAGPVVDLLPVALADVGHPEVAGGAVEGEAPRVAEPVPGDLPARLGGGDVRPQELAERGAKVLGALLGVAGGAAVAHADVQQPVGAELQLAAVVVVVRLVDEEQLLGAREDGLAARGAKLDDPGVAVPVGVVHVEETRLRVVRVKRHREEPLLAAALDAVADVEERRRAALPVHEHLDHARLLDDVDVPGLGRGRRQVDRRVEAAREDAEGGLVARVAREGGRDRDGSDEDECGEEGSQRAARSVVRAQGPGGVRRDSACRYASPAAGRSVHRSTQR